MGIDIKYENWNDNFAKTLLDKSACYKISLCTHGTGTINTKALYKLNVATEWEIKNEYYWDSLITSGREPSLANTKAVKLTKDFSLWIKSTSYLEEDSNSFFLLNSYASSIYR